MIKSIFSVFDNKSSVYCTPFTSINASTALRDFTYACNDPSSGLNQSPHDYSLYHIANFDDSSASIVPIFPPAFITMASSCLQPKGENHV